MSLLMAAIFSLPPASSLADLSESLLADEAMASAPAAALCPAGKPETNAAMSMAE